MYHMNRVRDEEIPITHLEVEALLVFPRDFSVNASLICIRDFWILVLLMADIHLKYSMTLNWNHMPISQERNQHTT